MNLHELCGQVCEANRSLQKHGLVIQTGWNAWRGAFYGINRE